ncbi:MAG: FCD domain-containing protein, partial [Pseudomonadota bacterium]
TKLCAQQVRGAQFLREAIEVSVIRRLAQGGPGPALADALTETLARQVRAIEDSDRSAFQALDDRFHTQLVETTGLARVRAVLDKERAMLARLRVLSLQQGDHMRRLHAEHGAILQAILGRDVEAAAKAAQMHLRGVLDTLADLVAANRDYFDADAD